METKTGVIIRVLEPFGYGFIRPDDGPKDGSKDIYFHQSGLVSPKDISDLREGCSCAYFEGKVDKKGRPRAIGVVAE